MATSPPCAEGSAVVLSGRQRRRVLWLVMGLGSLICLWRLGATGVTDETPPLFAAAGRLFVELAVGASRAGVSQNFVKNVGNI